VEGRTIVGYAGGHAPNHDLETLLDAASKIDPDRFCFILIGSGPSKKSLVQMVHKSGTRNVHFLDRTTRGRALATLSLTDAAYVGIAEGSLYRFGIGLNKIYDAMFVGRPIVAAYTAGNDPIGESACGFTSPAGDSDAVAAALVHLAAMNDDERNSMGLRGRKHVLNHHDYRHLSDRFLEAVQSSKSKGARSLPG
jgi:glycosyltransferase involved in cell wall biosynthesis